MADLIEHDDMGLLNALPTLQRDAARYRWLKNQLLAADFDWQGECVLVFKWPREIPVGGNLDKIVDAAISAAPGVPAPPALPTTEELERIYEEEHGGHPADFAADVLARWGGWMPGLLGHGGALQEAVKILTERTDGVPVAGKVVTVRQRGASTTEDIIDADGVETGEPRGPVHSCKNCAHLAKDSCDDPCAGCTVRWRSGVSDRWEPALGVSVARREPSTPSPTDGSAAEIGKSMETQDD